MTRLSLYAFQLTSLVQQNTDFIIILLTIKDKKSSTWVRYIFIANIDR